MQIFLRNLGYFMSFSLKIENNKIVKLLLTIALEHPVGQIDVDIFMINSIRMLKIEANNPYATQTLFVGICQQQQ